MLILLGILILSGCNLTAPPTTPVPTADLPRASFQFPSNNDQVFVGTDLTVDIAARDTTLGIGMVEFYVDGELMQSGEPPNGVVEVFRVNMNWLAEGIGLHTLSAVPYRPDGTRGDETIISIEVIDRTP